MQKLLAALLLVSPSVFADYYLVEIPSNIMANLVLEQNVPMPAFAEVDSGYVRGIVGDDTEYTSTYVENSHELFGMSKSTFQRMKSECGAVTLACVQQTFDDPGHGKATLKSSKSKQGRKHFGRKRCAES